MKLSSPSVNTHMTYHHGIADFLYSKSVVKHLEKVSHACAINILHIILTLPFITIVIPGAPQNLQISNHYAALNSSNMFNLTLTWSPPPMLETYGLTISMYIINCTNLQLPLQMNSILIRYTDALSVTFSNLCLFTSYNCCVAAISNHGRGKLACVPGR